MFIKLDQDAPRPWAVEYHEPKDGGGYTKHTFKALFKVPPQDHIDALRDQAHTLQREMFAGRATPQDVARLERELLDEVFTGWDDIKVPGGGVFEVSLENREILLNLPGLRSSLVTDFWEMVNGAGERKNSKPPRTTP